MAKDTLIRFSATVIDADEVRANCDAFLWIDSTTSVAAIETELSNWATAVQNCSDGKLEHCSYTVFSTYVGTDAAADSSVSEVGVIDYTLQGSRYVWGFGIPALADSLVVNDKIDPTNAEYLALRAIMLATTATINYSDNKKVALLAPSRTFRSARKHRRQQHSRTLGPA